MPQEKKSKTSRRKHSARAYLQILDLTRAGSSVELDVFADGELLGRISLGQGSINWKKAGKHKWGKPINWTNFADLMNREVHGED